MTKNRAEWIDLRFHLQQIFDAAIEAADPAAAVRRHLRLSRGAIRAGPHRLALSSEARIWLVAMGKASLPMASAAIEVLGDRLAAGVVAHPRGLIVGEGWPERVRLIPAGHPLPDEGSLQAGEAALELMERCAAGAGRGSDRGGVALGRGDVALVLVSGGGSALLESLPEGIELRDLREATRSLQRAGATIQELNTVRRALSRVKGGGLRDRAAPARTLALLLSDVLDDRPEAIASGPTIPSPTGPAQALEVLERHGQIAAQARIVRALRTPRGSLSAAPSSARADGASYWRIVASNRAALAAARRKAQEIGFRARVLTHRLQGEAREAGRVIGALAWGAAGRAPVCLLLGGETTVTVRGRGRGGRNLELALGAAYTLDGLPRAAVFSFATDGSDGNSGAAGAVATGETLRRAAALGLSADRAFAESDTEPFFRALDDLWVSGPTGTNVNDLSLALVYG